MDERPQTPGELRQGVREGILASIRRDVELRGGRTARLLFAAGLVGVVGAVGATILVSAHPFGHHPPGHAVVFSAVWAGLLVVSFAIAFLQVRTPTLPLAHAALVGILGLGLAGICGAACPDPHFLAWWSRTPAGGRIAEAAGLPLSALCFGLVTTLFVGAASAFLVLGDALRRSGTLRLSAAFLLVLLAPGVALQSVGTSLGVLAGWLAGTALGAWLGVAAGSRARVRLSRS